MALLAGLWARARGLDPRAVDLLVALILGVIIVVQEAAVVRPGAIEVLAGAGSAATVAWRRRAPVAATIAAAVCIGLLARSGGAPNPELVVLVLNFYMLGRGGSGERAWRSLEVLLVAVALPAVALVPGSSGVIDVVSTWAVFIVLPFASARVIGSRTAAMHEVQSDAQRLESEQRGHARRAIGEERIRIARELHDVIAHSVSVMVIQTAAARRLARQDHDAAGEALDAVAHCGREALSEMRRMVGVLHRGELDLAGAPGLMQLQLLADRARASGLPVEVRIDGDPRPLPQMIDLVAFRVVQEALTNVIKHAGDARAQVNVAYTTRTLDIDVIDDGRGPGRPDPGLEGTGHGLIGMQERLATYGGELQTGRGRGGGFRVWGAPPTDRGRFGMSPTRRAGGWFDPALAAVLLVAAEVEMIVRPRGGPFAVELGVVAAMTVPLAWRRRAPLPVAVVVMAMLVLLKAIDGDFHDLSFPLFAVLIPPYSVGAGEPRARALVGLTVCLAGVFAVHAVGSASGSFAFIVAMVTASWAAGQVLRARRLAAAKFKGKAGRITAERADRERLAVIDERSRIARELHAVVATAVSAMVLQTDAAQRLLAVDAARADEAMESIEEAGRRTLTEMRRVLGVLREENETAELAPQPGVGQIHTLIDNARGDERQVELKVQGEPGPLPASVNLGVYRILEEALESTPKNDQHPTDVTLRFGEQDVELTVTTTAANSLSWPTPATRERVALCAGAIDVEMAPSAATRLRVRLPSTFDAALL